MNFVQVHLPAVWHPLQRYRAVGRLDYESAGAEEFQIGYRELDTDAAITLTAAQLRVLIESSHAAPNTVYCEGQRRFWANQISPTEFAAFTYEEDSPHILSTLIGYPAAYEVVSWYPLEKQAFEQGVRPDRPLTHKVFAVPTYLLLVPPESPVIVTYNESLDWWAASTLLWEGLDYWWKTTPTAAYMKTIKRLEASLKAKK